MPSRKEKIRAVLNHGTLLDETGSCAREAFGRLWGQLVKRVRIEVPDASEDEILIESIEMKREMGEKVLQALKEFGAKAMPGKH